MDGLRFAAIALVICYHYYSRWTPPLSEDNLYAFGDQFANFFIFQYGHYGVQLFFMISGFVITYTLYRCRSFYEFAVRRFARLWPPMLLCSLTTMLVIKLVGHYFDAKPIYLLPSLAFTDPQLFNVLFRSNEFQYMDGAYWSLFVEVRFYLLISVLYFISPTRFPRVLIYFSLFVLATYLTASAAHLAWLTRLMRLFCIADYFAWFVIGIGAYFIHSGNEGFYGRLIFGLGIAAIIANSVVDKDAGLAIACFVGVLLFVGALTAPPVGHFFSRRIPVLVGSASYSLYLLHQSAGVELSAFASRQLSLEGTVAAIVPLFTALVLTLVSIAIFLFFEMRINKWIVAKVLFDRAARPAGDGRERTRAGSMNE